MLGLSLLLVDLGLDMEGMPSEMLPGTPLSMLLALVQSLLLLDLTRTLLALTNPHEDSYSLKGFRDEALKDNLLKAAAVGSSTLLSAIAFRQHLISLFLA